MLKIQMLKDDQLFLTQEVAKGIFEDKNYTLCTTVPFTLLIVEYEGKRATVNLQEITLDMLEFIKK